MTVMVAPERESTPSPAMSLKVWRCWRCAQVLAKLCITPGSAVEVKCSKCNALNTAALASVVDKQARTT